MRVAVCLYVRNEASDVASWLAWYRLLGVDSFIVIDDASTDCTLAVCEYAKRVQDVRVLRISPNERSDNYMVRQLKLYARVLREYRDEFEWIGFFDTDEYLRLYRDSSVQEFLRRFPDAGCISINWCNYGSSGHVFKPSVSPIAAYTHHSSPAAAVNRHVKSFVRPTAWTGGLRNPHAFDVLTGGMVSAVGSPMLWSTTVGITASDPDWSVAKIMHYQCRSLEHFLERLRRIPDLPATTDLWDAYNFKAERDHVPDELIRLHDQMIAEITLPSSS